MVFPRARLALQHQPLAAAEVPVDGLAALRPEQACRPTAGSVGDAAPGGTDRRTADPGRGQLHAEHAAGGAPVDPARPALHAGDSAAGQVEQQQPAAPELSASVAPAMSAAWSAGSISSRARSLHHHEVGADGEHGAVVLRRQAVR